MLDSPAWKDLDAVARALYIELNKRYNGYNNGRISYSARQGAQDLNISKATASRGLRSLQAHGFIMVEKIGAFHCKVRHASEYRLTIFESNVATNYATTLATKEFMHWPKIQNAVPPVRLTGLIVKPVGPTSETESSKSSTGRFSNETVEADFAK